jgi:hypothetical protein
VSSRSHDRQLRTAARWSIEHWTLDTSPRFINRETETQMNTDKKKEKKSTLRPWLVDVVVDNLR